MYKFKFWLKTSEGKTFLISFISVLITIIISLTIFLPIIFSKKISKNNAVLAFNRDSNSGTREAFENSINFNSNYQVFSPNVLTTNGNDDMIKKVESTTNTFGYVSLFSILNKSDSYQINKNLKILNFDGVNPIEDISNSMNNYDAKRYFNVFLRVNSKYNTLIKENLYNSTSPNNPWTSGGNIIDSLNLIDDFTNDYFLSDIQTQRNFFFSFIFYNWLAFSPSVSGVLDITPIKGDSNFDLNLQNLISNVDRINPNFLNLNSNSKSNIYTTGSTSVVTSLNKMISIFLSDFQKDFNLVLPSDPPIFTDSVVLQSLNKGSGDAFKSDKKINGSMGEHIWLGFQSRSPNISEISESNFNQTLISDSSSQDLYNLNENSIYFSFEIDALAFIINKNQEIKIKDNFGNQKTLNPIGIDKRGVNLIYTNSFSFENLYKLDLLEGEEV